MEIHRERGGLIRAFVMRTHADPEFKARSERLSHHVNEGVTRLLLARLDASRSTLRAFALLGTVFWTIAFIPFAFVDPVIQAIAVSAVAVPLHALAYVTASIEED